MLEYNFVCPGTKTPGYLDKNRTFPSRFKCNLDHAERNNLSFSGSTAQLSAIGTSKSNMQSEANTCLRHSELLTTIAKNPTYTYLHDPLDLFTVSSYSIERIWV